VRGLLDRAIHAVYREHGVTAGEERPLLAGDAPLEREIVAHIEGLSRENGLTARKQELLEKLHATLLQYVTDPTYGEGRYAHLVDRPTRVGIEDDVLCWNLDELAPRLYALTLFTITATMAHRAKSTFDAARGTSGAGTSAEFLAIDEGWFLSEFMKAGAELTNWAKRSRHIGLILAFASQQVSELIHFPGVQFIGPLPEALQQTTVFSGGVHAGAGRHIFNGQVRETVLAQQFERTAQDGETGLFAAWAAGTGSAAIPASLGLMAHVPNLTYN